MICSFPFLGSPEGMRIAPAPGDHGPGTYPLSGVGRRGVVDVLLVSGWVLIHVAMACPHWGYHLFTKVGTISTPNASLH